MDTIGSPFKKHRASMPGLGSGTFAPLGSTGPDAPFAPGSEATETTKAEEQHRAASTPEVKRNATTESDNEEL